MPRRRRICSRMLRGRRAGARRPAPATTSIAWSWASHAADRAGGGGLGRRVRAQPHPSARAHAPRQGGRPRAPDRRAQRPDRPGAARLSGRAAGSTAILAAATAGAAGCRRHRRRRRAPHALGDARSRHHRPTDGGLRRHAGAVHRRRSSPLGRRGTGVRRAPQRRPRHAPARRATTIFSASSSRITSCASSTTTGWSRISTA